MYDFCFPHRLKASDIMESCLSYIYPHTRVHSVIGILKTTAHNAFPVVTVDTGQETQESNYPHGNLDSSNERFARTTTFSNLKSEQRLRRHLSSGGESASAHRIRTASDVHSRSGLMDIKGKRLKNESDKDNSTYSSSAPGLSSLIDDDPVQDRVQFDYDGKEMTSCNNMLV